MEKTNLFLGDGSSILVSSPEKGESGPVSKVGSDSGSSGRVLLNLRFMIEESSGV